MAQRWHLMRLDSSCRATRSFDVWKAGLLVSQYSIYQPYCFYLSISSNLHTSHSRLGGHRNSDPQLTFQLRVRTTVCQAETRTSSVELPQKPNEDVQNSQCGFWSRMLPRLHLLARSSVLLRTHQSVRYSHRDSSKQGRESGRSRLRILADSLSSVDMRVLFQVCDRSWALIRLTLELLSSYRTHSLDVQHKIGGSFLT